jgi:hypothetical protein
MKLNPMETAPRDGTPILVWALWHWYKIPFEPGVYKATPRVCKWEGYEWEDKYYDFFLSITSNPYRDETLLKIGWLPLQHDYEIEVTV